MPTSLEFLPRFTIAPSSFSRERRSKMKNKEINRCVRKVTQIKKIRILKVMKGIDSKDLKFTT